MKSINLSTPARSYQIAVQGNEIVHIIGNNVSPKIAKNMRNSRKAALLTFLQGLASDIRGVQPLIKELTTTKKDTEPVNVDSDGNVDDNDEPE